MVKEVKRMKNPIGPRASVTLGGNYYFCTSCKKKHSKLSKIGKNHKVYAWPNQRHLLNPGTNWHVDRANDLRYLRKRTKDPGLYNEANARVLENELAADASRRLGMNPKRKQRKPSGKGLLPILVIGAIIIVAVNYARRTE